jgi:hypothetical protein
MLQAFQSFSLSLGLVHINQWLLDAVITATPSFQLERGQEGGGVYEGLDPDPAPLANTILGFCATGCDVLCVCALGQAAGHPCVCRVSTFCASTWL